MSQFSRHTLIGISLWIGLSFNTGCSLPGQAPSKPESQESQPASSPSSTQPDSSSPAPTKEAEPSAKGPNKLPADVPFYSGGKITTETAQESSYALTYTVQTAGKTVFSFYESELKKQGWTVKASTSVDVPFLGASVMPIVAEKGDRTCTVNITGKSDSECHVVVVTGTKQSSTN